MITRMGKRGSLTTTFIAGALFLAACSSSDEQGATATGSPYKIGVVGVTSGTTAIYGLSVLWGAQAAADEINARGGIDGHKFKLISRDDQQNPGVALGAVKELVESQNINALIGTATTNTSTAILPYVAQKKVPQLMGSASGLALSPTKNPGSYKVQYTDSSTTAAIVQYMIQDKGYKKPAIIYEDDAYGQQLLDYYKGSLNILGVKPVTIQSMSATAVNVTSQLLRIRDSGADVLFVIGLVEPEATVTKGLRKLGYNIPVADNGGFTVPGYLSLVKSYLPNTFSPTLSVFTGEGQTPEIAKKLREIQAAHQNQSLGWGQIVAGYGCIKLLAHVAETNDGVLNYQTITRVLNHLDNFSTLFTHYSFSPTNHQTTVDLTILDLTGVTPEQLASNVLPGIKKMDSATLPIAPASA